jgi:hypothetical protein
MFILGAIFGASMVIMTVLLWIWKNTAEIAEKRDELEHAISARENDGYGDQGLYRSA